MRKRIRCSACGRPAHRLYIRQVKGVPLEIKEEEEEMLPLIKKFNPRLTKKVRRWKAVGYWCGFCGNVEVKETPKFPKLRQQEQAQTF